MAPSHRSIVEIYISNTYIMYKNILDEKLEKDFITIMEIYYIFILNQSFIIIKDDLVNVNNNSMLIENTNNKFAEIVDKYIYKYIDVILKIYNNRKSDYYKIYKYCVNNKKMPNEVDSKKMFKIIKDIINDYNDNPLKETYDKWDKIPYWNWNYDILTIEYISYIDVVKKIINDDVLSFNDIIIKNEIIKKYKDGMLCKPLMNIVSTLFS